jgi:hypothetical protein
MDVILNTKSVSFIFWTGADASKITRTVNLFKSPLAILYLFTQISSALLLKCLMAYL